MNVPSVLEQPALPLELSATLELAADFARRRRHRRRRQPTGAIVGIGVQPPAAVDIQLIRRPPGRAGRRGRRYSTNRPLFEARRQSPNAFKHFLEMKMGFDRKLSTAEVTAAVERAFARQEGREPKLPSRPDNPIIGELASLDTLEYELQRDTAAAGLGIRVSALDKLVKGRRAAKEDENAALPHWNVEPSAEPVDGAALLNNLRRVFRRYVVLPKGADIALPLWVLHAWTMDAGDISPLMVLVSPTKRCGKSSVLICCTS
jgi:hypothetical protein